MHYLQGHSALTDYRCEQLYQAIKRFLPALCKLAVYHDYWVQVKRPLQSDEKPRLRQLLNQAVLSEAPQDESAVVFWVTPRIGVISPWSSKATDIAHICGLDAILRLEQGMRFVLSGVSYAQLQAVKSLLHQTVYDPLTQSIIYDFDELKTLFRHGEPQPLADIPLLEQGLSALLSANEHMGLSLSESELNYLLAAYQRLGRNPTDVELMMFAQVNSEHCRHKIFNANWTIDQQAKEVSLFQMIRHTYQHYPDKVLVAYSDNAAVVATTTPVHRFVIDPQTHVYQKQYEQTPYVLKVETHNHPTAISPFAGAATGSGGEIRDEAATGCGAQAKAGLCGFSVSHLRIPDLPQPWEMANPKPPHVACALDIMLQAPIGAASFNNEFGRPNILGYFRSFEMRLSSQYGEVHRGYHKPIMIAGGIGHIRPAHVEKKTLFSGVPLIVLGGEAMSIGLGGGSASSRQHCEGQESLDFASVQRANPEMQRRAQEVINACCALGQDNPILSIHDVGAGGLSNALPELVHACDLGAAFNLRAIPNVEPQMSPLAIWCNEAQERYVLAIKPHALEFFTVIAKRERCPFAVIGQASENPDLRLQDPHFNNQPIDLPLSVLFDEMPALSCSDEHAAPAYQKFATDTIDLAEAIKRVLQYPCVASKNFLITIGDRSVGGMVSRDQLVGPWQVPVADCGVTTDSFDAVTGQAIAMGERPPIALLHHAASARMALAEAITNIASAAIDDISDIVLSANWMAAADYPGEAAGLYDAVQTVAMEICPALNVVIPVGKDSLSMRTSWQQNASTHAVTAPLSLIISAAANVVDVRSTLTPQLRQDVGETRLLLLDLGKGANLLGASVLAQVYNTLGDRPPDLDDPQLLGQFFNAIQELNRQQLIFAYHDRSDGGLLATLCEMMFAAHVGVDINLDALGADAIASLFAEELGAVIQVKADDMDKVMTILSYYQLQAYCHDIGVLNHQDQLRLTSNRECFYQESRVNLQRWWSQNSYELQRLRDYPPCAQQEFDALLNTDDVGLNARVNFDFDLAPVIQRGIKPKVAILREQGVNGHVEMAAAFDRAGFTSVDVHMSDILAGRQRLSDFKALAACGGFSYGDVLGAGRGWAQSILMHAQARDEFAAFFQRQDTVTVGMCNGCQMLSGLREIIPGASHWPAFLANQSEQFEARLSLVKIAHSPSVVLRDMAEAVIPVVVSHAQGRVAFAQENNLQEILAQQLIGMHYVDNQHQVTLDYPANPNGSVDGIAALTNQDGRITIMMPHPERVFRSVQMSWHPQEWQENSPWMKLFYNAYEFVN